MAEISIEQIRNFRLGAHHLDKEYKKTDMEKLTGACGMQNTPPGAWETALFNRIPDCSLTEMEYLLYKEKTLLQTWSLRGIPVVFPALESDVFLSALIPQEDEPWIYTAGITLALDFLQMGFHELFEILQQVIPQLDHCTVISKTSLDQNLAEWMLPLLPEKKRALWTQPSMYGSPDKQTVGGAVVSFLLRPCALKGLVVFGGRQGTSPVFTSYKNWTGYSFTPNKDACKKLMRKYLHCYGPATPNHFAAWLGCSGKQARRMWKTVSEETEPVMVFGKKTYILSSDKERLLSPDSLQRELLLLGGHDPFLDQRDRAVLQPDKTVQKQIWRFVSHRGTGQHRGEIIGIWTGKKKNKGMEIKITLWNTVPEKQKLQNLAEEYTVFRNTNLSGFDIILTPGSM